jgi:hypothetical protein
VLTDRDMGWLVRRADDDFDQGVRVDVREDEPLQRLVLLIDSAVDVLTLARDLRRTTPDLLLSGTGAHQVIILDAETERRSLEPIPLVAPDGAELNDLGTLIERLRHLRRLAAEAS